MKLISQIVNKRMLLYQEFELNHDYLKSIWHFYSVYNICSALIGHVDTQINLKNNLIRKLILKFNMKDYQVLLKYIKKDMAVINLAIDLIDEKKEEANFLGDYYVPGSIGISVYD